MRSKAILFLPFLVVALLSCNSSTTKKEESTVDTTKKITADTATTSTKEMHLLARFDEFSLGDASHFLFTDTSGKQWDFGGNEDTVYKFAIELPNDKSNTTNQGWTYDKKLKGKLFDLAYVNRTQALYIDGPQGEVHVIIKATLKE